MALSWREQTFENYFVGNFNKLAFSVFNSLGSNQTINVVFVSGGVGCGKTHLLNSVFNRFNGIKKIKLLNCEDLIRSIWENGNKDGDYLNNLHRKICENEFLLLDDVQFFNNKSKCLEFLYGILEEFIKNKKFIVFSSDKTLNTLNDFDLRLKSRLSSGIVLNISKPDLVSLKNICEEKIKKFENVFIIQNECVDFLIRKCGGDIRVLDGEVNKMFFFATSLLPPKSVISMDFMKTIFDEFNVLENNDNKINVGEIIKYVCDLYGVDVGVVCGVNKTKQINLVRCVCMYILKYKLKTLSLLQIGSFFNNRSHSVVLDGVKKIKNLMEQDNKMSEFIQNIINNV